MADLAQEVQNAYQRISEYIVQTPLTFSHQLSGSSGVEVYLKNEHLQHTGSFKLRGALNKILSLTPQERKLGVVAASTGNHGLGVAYASRLAGIQATIFVPENASPAKLKGIIGFGAKLVTIKGDSLEAELSARATTVQTGQVFISPYNDLSVIAGQGTVGLEIIRQIKDLDAVFVSVGGGGLISGIATYLKKAKPVISIVGCWPENSPIMLRAMKAGTVIPVHEKPTLSDATAGGLEQDCVTLPLCQKLIDEQILVSEQEIQEAIHTIAITERYIVEGSAGVALAALIQQKQRYQGRKVAIVLCGRNIDFEKFRQVMELRLPT